jgi:acyl carrier protein
MIDFIALFNRVARVARPAHHAFAPLETMDQRFEDSDLDSLDMLMIAIYFSDIYGIDEKTAKEMQPETLQQLYDLVQLHKTKDPASIEEAVGWMK